MHAAWEWYGVYIAPVLGVTVAFWLMWKFCQKVISPLLPDINIDRVHAVTAALADGLTLVSGEPTHVYHFYDRQGNLLYVGITNDLRRRWAQHEADKPWWHLVARKESVQYPTREEAERVEEHQIRTHRPMFNRAMNGWLR